MNSQRVCVLIALCLFACPVLAGVSIPGTSEADQLDTLGTMAKTLDVVIFIWGAKIAAAVVFLLGGWAIKENRLGVALLCLCAGFLILFAPKLATEIQSLSGIKSVFGGE
ncbi:MAG: hypothetical protein HYW48_02450 [Deltaproteobacteria bacterium]|nr:hypothetical protein [Deltaproteobacteria bacterium]